ncbi:MAG: hypothetical protein WCA35_13865 [Kovacikia sp.]
MNPIDPIILTAYILSIAYFIYQIIDSFNDEFTARLDEDLLKRYLSEHKLDNVIGISFGFGKRYEFNKLDRVPITISNKSNNYSIYVDWDYSTFTDLENRARRVARLAPGTTLDLFQNQVFSTVAPNTTLKETITAEDIFQRKGERKDDKLDTASPLNLEVEITKPLIDLKPEKPSDGLKKQLEKFKRRKLELSFSLELVFRIVGPDRALSGDRIRIPCKFILKKLPWMAGLPWNPK